MTTMSAPAAAVQLENRARRYYTADRPEIVELVQPIAAACSKSAAAAGIWEPRFAYGHWVAGVELSPEMAEEARHRVDHVVCGDIETLSLPWSDGSFDAIICADVSSTSSIPGR